MTQIQRANLGRHFSTKMGDGDPMKFGKFYSEILFAEHEIMQLYKAKFNIDPINDNTYKVFTEEEQIHKIWRLGKS